jgi:hypothetical protein
MRLAVGLLIATLVTAGCTATPNESPQGTKSLQGTFRLPFVPAEVPENCDALRPAVAHKPGGELAEYSVSQAIFPCMSRTGSVSREPTIGITSKGSIFHYPAMVGDNTQPMGVAISRDQGKTFSRVLPGIAGQPFHRSSLDPYLYVDPMTDRIFADDLLTAHCSYFSWSDDDGATWEHSYSGCLEADHQTIFGGKPVTTSPVGYPNLVYRCAINTVALGAYGYSSTCMKSIDGGRTWLLTLEPAFITDPADAPNLCTGAHGHGIADHRGWIYLPKEHCDVPMLAISKDEGDSWTRVAVSSIGISGHDAGVGVDREGTIYYSWVAGDGLPYIAYSKDDGRTWSDPIMVGAPEVTHARFAEMYVGGVGKVAWVYMGRLEPINETFPQTYGAFMGVSYDLLSENPTLYSATVHDPVADPFVVGGCCGGVQDFIDVRIGPDGTPWGAFVDDCLGEGVRCSTREILPGVPEALDTQREGVAGWFWGGPSLWDEADPNGPYPD